MFSVENQLPAHSDDTAHHLGDSDFLLQRCSHCDGKIKLVEGDIIYGDKWFHENCWKSIKGGTKDATA